METIASAIRRGIPWVALPLGAASLFRLAVEPRYATLPFALWVLLIPAYALLLRFVLSRPNPRRIRLALLTNFLGINVGYTMIGLAMGSSPGWRADSLVRKVDSFLFRGEPQRLLVPLQHPWISDIAMAGYLSFAGFLVYLFLCEAFRLGPDTGRLQLGLMRLYGIGFSGYLLLPAAGPAFDHPAALPVVAHSALTARLNPWVLSNCSHVDVCPSIHAAITAFILCWTFQRNLRLFFCLVPLGAALLLGTVYFQYHYFTDLPFGAALGACAALTLPNEKPDPVLRPVGPAD